MPQHHLSADVRKSLDGLSADMRRAVHRYLSSDRKVTEDADAEHPFVTAFRAAARDVGLNQAVSDAICHRLGRHLADDASDASHFEPHTRPPGDAVVAVRRAYDRRRAPAPADSWKRGGGRVTADEPAFGEQNSGKVGGSPFQESRVARTNYGGDAGRKARDETMANLPQTMPGGLQDERRAQEAFDRKRRIRTMDRGNKRMAADSAVTVKPFTERFPNAARISIV